MNDIWNDMQVQLDELAERDLLRRPLRLDSPVGPRIVIDGREVLCLCSNDYLALANDPAVKAATINAIEQWGLGSGASRLVSGTMAPHVQLERDLAAFKHTDDAMVTSTGWMANRAAITAMVQAGDLILADKLNHASIIDAATGSGARLRTYHHNDMDRLAALLKRHRGQYRRCLIVTDSLFSMDGDLAPLDKLVELKQQYNAQLMIDEAHATGVLGSNGHGAAELFGVEGQTDVTVGTMSKGLGGIGGFVAGRAELIQWLRTSARAYIYTTALPPAMCAATSEALRIVQTQPQRRGKLLTMATELRRRFNAAGLNTAGSESQIIPVIIGAASDAVRISGQLLEAGFFVPAIRPPTVPPNTSRLRISLSAGHDETDIQRLADAVIDLVAMGN